MAGFDALYKHTVTLFNRVKDLEGNTIWKPAVLKNVHLILSSGSSWDSRGGSKTDSALLHVRYELVDGEIMIGDRKYYLPKQYQERYGPDDGITFANGNNNDFDFFIEGEIDIAGTIMESDFGRHGFYNYVNKKYDNVYAITSVSKYDLIPHFEISAR